MNCHERSCDQDDQRNRGISIQRAKRLALLTVGWNLFEGVAALFFGYLSGSVALVGFGLDSAIETASAAIVGWRFWSEEQNTEANEQLERKATQAVGFLLIILAAYIGFDATRKLVCLGEQTKASWPGIFLTVAALIIMPLLARAKYKSAQDLNSKAMKAEAFQSVTCAWLAGTTLLGLALNALFHWKWADPTAALLFTPVIIKEGLEAIKGKPCCSASPI